jgi:glycosyltransferase involved in cell wall biosynthesis
MNITIALAVYNGEKYLPQLLESLVKQTTLPFELIIIDDHSTDDSWSIIQSFKTDLFKVRFYKNESNRGVVYTFKKLVSLCQTEYLAFCDQDDIWLENKLTLSLNKMEELEKKSVNKPLAIFTDLIMIDEENDIIQNSFFQYFNIKCNNYLFLDILFDNIITGCTLLINKRMIEELLKMPDNILMHDYWVALICFSIGEVGVCNQPTILYRVHKKSITSKNKKNILQLIFHYFNNFDKLLDKKNIQSHLFAEIYNSQLSVSDKKQLLFFQNLSKSWWLKKILIKWITKYLKDSYLFRYLVFGSIERLDLKKNKMLRKMLRLKIVFFI